MGIFDHFNRGGGLILSCGAVKYMNHIVEITLEISVFIKKTARPKKGLLLLRPCHQSGFFPIEIRIARERLKTGCGATYNKKADDWQQNIDFHPLDFYPAVKNVFKGIKFHS